MRWLLKRSVWCSGAIPPLERKYADPLKRVVFPAFDLLMLILAIRSLHVGIPSIDALLPNLATTLLYWAWGLVAGLCFIGAAFPRLWKLEIGGKISLFAMLTVYLVALRLNETGDGTKDATTVFVVVAMLFPMLRLWILGIEERDRKGS